MSKAQFLSYLGLVKRPVKKTTTLASELSCDFRRKKKICFLQDRQTPIFLCDKSGQFCIQPKKKKLSLT